MEERGVREEGVSRAIREGQRYDTQQIEVIVAEESERVVVVTVYAFYF